MLAAHFVSGLIVIPVVGALVRLAIIALCLRGTTPTQRPAIIRELTQLFRAGSIVGRRRGVDPPA
jgi:hypothetical protein